MSEVSNETLFYLFAGLGIAIALGIYFIAISIGQLVSNKGFQERLANKRKEDVAKVIILLLMLGLGGDTFAQSGIEESTSILGEVTRGMVWSVFIIDLFLLAILFYMRSHFRSLVKVAFPEVIEQAKEKKKKAARSALTDRVPMEEEHTILLDHDYDGIQELDNNLPPWWKYGFYLSIIAGVIYLFNYHVFQLSDLQVAAYEADMERAEIEVQAYLAAQALNVDENSVLTMTEASDLNKGKEIFETLCATCHLKDGGGLVGPNLTDDHWLYGPDIKSIFTTVKYGAQNGMKSWKDELNPVEIQQVSSYIRTLHGTTPEKPKPAEGEFMEWIPDPVAEEGDPAEPAVPAVTADSVEVAMK